jgi:hypothetical protein
MADFDQDVAWAEVGDRPLIDLDPLLAAVDGDGHHSAYSHDAKIPTDIVKGSPEADTDVNLCEGGLAMIGLSKVSTE